MRRTIFTGLLLVFALVAYAQEGTLTNVYELKKVATADTIKASKLYVKALEVLSDWAGSNSKSKMGIDVQDKDEGLVVYKGNVHLGFDYYSKFAGAGFDVYIDMTIKENAKMVKYKLRLPFLVYHLFPIYSVW